MVTSAYRPMRSYSETSNDERRYGSRPANTAARAISATRTGAGQGTRARRIAAWAASRSGGDLGSRAPADQDEHDDERDDEAVLRVDVADDELLEDAERIAAEQGEADRAEPAEHGRRKAVHGDRDVRAVRHRVARGEQGAAERAERSRADERDDSKRADVRDHELGRGPGVGAGDQGLADDRLAQKEGQHARRQQRHTGDQDILRLDENAADVPGAIGDAGIAAGDVAELEEKECLAPRTPPRA